MVLRHVMEHESGHFGRLIHPCSVVERVVSPNCRKDRRNARTIGTMTSGALRDVDGFAGNGIAFQGRNFDKPPTREGLTLDTVSSEPVDVGDQSLHLGAVR